MKVDVLGTKYNIGLLDEPDECMEQMNADGYCDYSTKEIKILKIVSDIPTHRQDPSVYQEQLYKHELIHAFLYESGNDLPEWNCEEMVDWVAMQFDKMQTAFKEVIDSAYNN